METITIDISGINLISPKMRKFYKILGFIFSSLGVFLLIFKIIKQDFDIVMLSVISNLLFGLYSLMIGFRIVHNKVNEYIKINDKQIEYKPTFFKKSKIVDVDKIKEIRIASVSINFNLDDEDFRINLNWISYVNVIHTKKAIRTFARLKQIKITG